MRLSQKIGDASSRLDRNFEKNGREGVQPFMRSPGTITLFAESTDIGQKPIAFFTSILLHCLTIGLVSFGVLFSPRLDRKAIAERYNLRRLDLAMPDEAMRRTASSKLYPAPKLPDQKEPSTGKPAVMRQVAQAPKGPQMLLQPDLTKQITLPDPVQVPTLMVWAHSKTAVKTIVAPPSAKPTSANIHPSPAPPTQEANLADISIAASELPHPKLPALPSTTSPIAVQGPEVQMAPASISQVSAQPTPAAVMSLSDIHMAQGTVVLPPVNESAASKSDGVLAPGKAHNSAPGTGNHDGKGGSGNPAGTGGGANGTARTIADGRGAASSLPDGNGTGNQIKVTRITLPKDGQFGSVVVGASLEDQFPEMTHVWAGRLAYTVYLHVGLARSWILQYSLPMADEAASAGSISHLDAPWPYNIVRPNLEIDPSESEAIMVHGYVNQSGHFEGLKVVFPPQLPQTQFVLASLQQWQFRPAARNGQLARVEVLLIIPEELR
jgi:hypothetical protein